MASEVPTTPIEIAKSRTTLEERPCDPEEELDEEEDAVPDAVPVLLPVCDVKDVEEIVDEVLEESRTSKLNHNKSIFSRFPKDDGQLT